MILGFRIVTEHEIMSTSSCHWLRDLSQFHLLSLYSWKSLWKDTLTLTPPGQQVEARTYMPFKLCISLSVWFLVVPGWLCGLLQQGECGCSVKACRECRGPPPSPFPSRSWPWPSTRISPRRVGGDAPWHISEGLTFSLDRWGGKSLILLAFSVAGAVIPKKAVKTVNT